MRRKKTLFYRTVTAKNLRIGKAASRRWLWVWLMGLLVLASLLGGLIFEAGKYFSTKHWGENPQEQLSLAHRELDRLKDELDRYKKQAESADVAVALAKASEQKSMEEVQRLTKALEQANDDLVFFQKMIPPNNLAHQKGISVRNAEVRKLSVGVYHFRALLYVSETPQKTFDGFVEWLVDQDGKQVPISPEGRETLHFSQYRRLDKTVTLPSGIQPRQAWLKIYDQSGNLKTQIAVQIIR
jgi:hypothetical protein